jgi:hypothetical protein
MERETVWFRHQTVLFYIANKSATLSLLVRCNARPPSAVTYRTLHYMVVSFLVNNFSKFHHHTFLI